MGKPHSDSRPGAILPFETVFQINAHPGPAEVETHSYPGSAFQTFKAAGEKCQKGFLIRAEKGNTGSEINMRAFYQGSSARASSVIEKSSNQSVPSMT